MNFCVKTSVYSKTYKTVAHCTYITFANLERISTNFCAYETKNGLHILISCTLLVNSKTDTIQMVYVQH